LQEVRGDARDVVLVDGSRVLSYYYHTIPMLHLADGRPVNAVVGYWNLLRKLPAWFPDKWIGTI
jgi:DNA polymerase-1